MKQPITDVDLALQNSSTAELLYRRVRVKGKYNFKHEMLLRNRRFDKKAGVHVLTPLKLEGTARHFIVNRGFVPLELSKPELRAQFQKNDSAEFVAIIKESNPRRFLAPSDPNTGPGHPWVDAWLRVDLTQMQKQLPYKIEPAYLEKIPSEDPTEIEAQIVTAKSGKDELLVMGLSELLAEDEQAVSNTSYPIPILNTVIPPGRHLGYVYEWAFMALITFLICLVLQLRPKAKLSASQASA